MFVMPSVQRSHANNLAASKRKGFVEDIIDEIQTKRMKVVRIHVAGDYYNAAYVEKWHEIVKACPNTIFFTYTRSWRVPAIESAIKEFIKCKNLRMWYSIDGETGYPSRIPARVRTAYMSITMNDIPDHKKTDLVFRDYGIRGAVQKRVNGVTVCPPENGITKLTCEQCGICWRRSESVPKGIPDNKRMSLQLVA